MPKLLLPGTRDFEFAIPIWHNLGASRSWRIKQGERTLHTIQTLWQALRGLHAANAEGTCPTCPTAAVWKSKELRPIREALEEEAT